MQKTEPVGAARCLWRTNRDRQISGNQLLGGPLAAGNGRRVRCSWRRAGGAPHLLQQLVDIVLGGGQGGLLAHGTLHELGLHVQILELALEGVHGLGHLFQVVAGQALFQRPHYPHHAAVHCLHLGLQGPGKIPSSPRNLAVGCVGGSSMTGGPGILRDQTTLMHAKPAGRLTAQDHQVSDTAPKLQAWCILNRCILIWCMPV